MKNLLISSFLILFSISSFGQIPITKFTQNVMEFDLTYNSLMEQINYKKSVGRYYVTADMNNDNKMDFVLHAYNLTGTNGEGTVNIFYNESNGSIVKFKNNSQSGLTVRGNTSPMFVGDVNNDNKLDILQPTGGYHGDPANMPAEHYPNTEEHEGESPDKLYVQTDTGFKEYLEPDTLFTLSGSLIDTDGDGAEEFISSTYDIPEGFLGNNLLIKYSLDGDSLKGDFWLETPQVEGKYYKSYVSQISQKFEDSFYLPLTQCREDPILDISYPDTVFILKFRKGLDNYYAHRDCDTVGIVPIPKHFHKGVLYYYEVLNEYGTYIYDIDNDGKEETIVVQYPKYEGNVDYTWNWQEGDPLISRIKIYNNKGDDLTDKFIPQEFQYDPQNYPNTDGIILTDINGDGLKDIVPYNSWGWANFTMEFEKRKNKYVLLNTGKSFKPFTVDFGNNSSIIENIGAYPCPFNLNSESEKALFIIREGGINADVLELDYSQFQYPCESNLPEINLSGKVSLCDSTDYSIFLETNSTLGYTYSWLKDGVEISNTNSLLVKDMGNYILHVGNLGGCENIQDIHIQFPTSEGNLLVTTNTDSLIISDVNYINPPAEAFVIKGNTSPQRGTIEIYSVPDVSGVDFEWTFPEGWEIISSDNSNLVKVNVGTVSGIITVTPSAYCGNLKKIEKPVSVYTYIPDNNFQEALRKQGIDRENKPDSVLSESIIDVVELIVSDENIIDLTGIQDFLNLRNLDCSNNQLNTLNIEHNSVLKELNCSSNNLSNIHLSDNMEITHLECSNNQLANLNLTNNKKLVSISCEDNQLTSLDVSQNKLLSGLLFGRNKISNINLTENAELGLLACELNLITTLDLSNNINLTFLDCNSNQIKKLDVSKNSSLTDFKCYNNNLVYLNLKNGTNSLLTYMDASNNPNLSCINVDNPELANNYVQWYKDATSSYSDNCTSTEIIQQDLSRLLKIYPNPIDNELTIEFEGNTSETNFDVLNSIGQSVYQGKLVKKTVVQTSNFTSGIYVIRFSTGEMIEYKKIVKH